MDAARLLSVLQDIESEFAAGYLKMVTSLIQAYTGARDSPSTDMSIQIGEAMETIKKFLGDSGFDTYPPSKKKILESIGGSRFLGSSAHQEIESRLSRAGITPASIVVSLTEFQSEVDRFRKACNQARLGLTALGISPHELKPGECEVGVLIPESITDGKLAGLDDQLKQWNIVLRGVAEVADEDEREITVSGLATGSNEIYLLVGIATAKCLAKVIDKVFEWYRKVLEIQELRKKLKDLDAPTAEIADVRRHEKQLVEKGIADLVSEIVQESGKHLQQPRRKELENQLTISIRHVVKFVDQGGDVEVVVGQPEEVDDEEVVENDPEAADETEEDVLKAEERRRLAAQAEEATAISLKGAALRHLGPRTQQILQLENGDTNEEKPVKAERPEKKK